MMKYSADLGMGYDVNWCLLERGQSVSLGRQEYFNCITELSLWEEGVCVIVVMRWLG